MSSGVCPEDVYGVPNFFTFLLMYVKDFPMILWWLDASRTVCIEIHSDKIVILTDSFCTANPYVWKFETQKTVPLFGKRGTVLVRVAENRYGPSLGPQMSKSIWTFFIKNFGSYQQVLQCEFPKTNRRVDMFKKIKYFWPLFQKSESDFQLSNCAIALVFDIFRKKWWSFDIVYSKEF